MKNTKERQCKDCRSVNVITPLDRKGKAYLDDIHIELCAPCLHTRAQLQSAKENKLPFPKLLAKIQSETNKRVRNEIMSAYSTPMYRIKAGYYKGPTVYATLSEYWVKQLSKD